MGMQSLHRSLLIEVTTLNVLLLEEFVFVLPESLMKRQD